MKKGVQKIFSQVVDRYELINHLLTWGLDVVWRRKAAKLAVAHGGKRWLDICTGTGEMVAYLTRQMEQLYGVRRERVRKRRRAREKKNRVKEQEGLPLNISKNDSREALISLMTAQKLKSTSFPLVIALDFCREMLLQVRKTKCPQLFFPLKLVQADAARLPFPDKVFDGISISFATRNLGLDSEKLLPIFQEVHRVLRPGGIFLNLETSQPKPRWLRRLFHLYIRVTVKPIGSRLSGSKPGYAYLAYTVPRFLPSDELKNTLVEAGFSSVIVKKLFLGIAAIHIAFK